MTRTVSIQRCPVTGLYVVIDSVNFDSQAVRVFDDEAVALGYARRLMEGSGQPEGGVKE